MIHAGGPGYGSHESLINLSLCVLDLEPDLIIVYHGINDVHFRFVWPPAAYRGDNSGFTGTPPRFQMPPLFEYSTMLRIMLVRLGLSTPHRSLQRILGPLPETSYSVLFERQKREGTYPDRIFREVPARLSLYPSRQ